jgi:cytochrome c-type biogenesis protein
LAFALGRAIPILFGALAMGWLENLSELRRFQTAFEVLGGLVLILAGLYLLNAYFFAVPGLAA